MTVSYNRVTVGRARTSAIVVCFARSGSFGFCQGNALVCVVGLLLNGVLTQPTTRDKPTTRTMPIMLRIKNGIFQKTMLFWSHNRQNPYRDLGKKGKIENFAPFFPLLRIFRIRFSDDLRRDFAVPDGNAVLHRKGFARS